jgi:hypothetical protein
VQFGFKPNRLTAMCAMVITEFISYYVKNNSNVHCVIFWMLHRHSIELNMASYSSIYCHHMLFEFYLICI